MDGESARISCSAAVPALLSDQSCTPALMQATAAIQALNGATISGCQLVVKFADADVQPRVESGRQPSEWWCVPRCHTHGVL